MTLVVPIQITSGMAKFANPATEAVAKDAL
jgi:hypothetical protein